MRWLQTLIYGLISGLTEILPVSSHAHRLLLIKLFGITKEPELLRLMTDLGVMIALYISSQTQIVRILRARRLARIPKSRRKRPLDTRSLMDLSLLRTMAIPVILVFVFYNKIAGLVTSMLLVALFLFLNGVILYIPQFFPGSNRDSRTLSRVDGLLMGLGGAVSVIPGFSGVGTAISIGSMRGVERSYALNMTLMLNTAVCAGFLIYDVLGLVTYGAGLAGFVTLVQYIFAGLVSFGAATLAIKAMRAIAANWGYTFFAYYCWGMAMFTFIMNLLA